MGETWTLITLACISVIVSGAITFGFIITRKLVENPNSPRKFDRQKAHWLSLTISLRQPHQRPSDSVCLRRFRKGFRQRQGIFGVVYTEDAIWRNL